MGREFRILKTLGQGSFGAVHLVEVRDDQGFVQNLAVKWLRPEWSTDPELLGRLRDEARLLGLLQHDHVVRVHGISRIEGRLAILMEPVDGVDLSHVEGAVPLRVVIEVAMAVAGALHAAWETVPLGNEGPLRVVHRDIKPSNIMVTPLGAVKVMDFGVARATFEARESDTRSQQYGTARYMAPERWLEGVAEAPSDVFSLGITLLELILGEPVSRLRLAPQGFSADLAALCARVPVVEVAALITEMCSYKPENRPTADQIVGRCELLAGTLEPPTLRGWAQAKALPTGPVQSPRDGTVVHEDSSSQETFDVLGAPSVGLGVASATSGLDRTEDVSAGSPAADPPTRQPGSGDTASTGAIAARRARSMVPVAIGGALTLVAVSVVGLPSASRFVEIPAERLLVNLDDRDGGEVVVPLVTPRPIEAPLPVVEPDSTPSPAPRPRPVEEVPAAEPGTLVVHFNEAVTAVRTADGTAVGSRRGIRLPKGVHDLTVESGGETFRCTVRVGDVTEVEVLPEERGCIER